MIGEFIQSTYEQAATLGKWDRATLERHDLPDRPESRDQVNVGQTASNRRTRVPHGSSTL